MSKLYGAAPICARTPVIVGRQEIFRFVDTSPSGSIPTVVGNTPIEDGGSTMQAVINTVGNTNRALSRFSGVVPVMLRVVLGFVMAAHGWQKVERGSEGVDGLSAFLDAEGVLLPGLVAGVVPWLEFLGGIALILGLATRLVATALAIELLLAAAIITAGNGLIGPRGGGVGYERDLVYAAGLIALVFTGPGRPSIDHLLGIEPRDRSGDLVPDSAMAAGPVS